MKPWPGVLKVSYSIYFYGFDNVSVVPFLLWWIGNNYPHYWKQGHSMTERFQSTVFLYSEIFRKPLFFNNNSNIVVTKCGKHNLRKGCPDIFSLSRASEISRQYLLFRTIVLRGRKSLGAHQSAWVLHCVSLSRMLSLLDVTCVDQLERHSSLCGWTNSPNRGCGCARIRQMYIIVYLAKMVSFLSVMFANSSAIAPRSLEWLYDSGKLLTLTLTTHLGQNVGSFLT